jgi:predicted transcriptional regulator
MPVKYELGPLEMKIMEIMWEKEISTVHDVHEELSKEREIALTTVSTTMDRLFKKKLLSRETDTGKGGIFYNYKVKINKESFHEKASKHIANKLIKNYGKLLASKIVDEIQKYTK